MTVNEVIESLSTWYKMYDGIKEGSQKHREIVDIYNSYVPHPRGYTLKYTDSWCAAFMSAGAIQMNLTSIIPVECGAQEWYNLATDMCAVYHRGSDLKVGDFVLYDWDDNNWSDHIGFIINTAPDYVEVIEGNKSDAVGIRHLDRQSSNIYASVRPLYSRIATENDYFYQVTDAWCWDGTGWWYPYGHNKGEYHTNNAVRINNELYFFDAQGYCVKNPDIQTKDTGELVMIFGERVGK